MDEWGQHPLERAQLAAILHLVDDNNVELCGSTFRFANLQGKVGVLLVVGHRSYRSLLKGVLRSRTLASKRAQMSVRPQANGTPRQGCCSRCCESLCEAAIAAVKRWRKRRERKRLREELEAENLVVKRNVVTSTLDTTPLGQVTLASGELVDITSALMFRPTLRERIVGRRYISLRRDNGLVGNLEILRGGLWLPKPPLDVTGTTSSGKLPCYDQGIQRSVKLLMAKATF